MGHLAKTVKQAQIMGAFEDFGLVKSVDVSHFYTIFLVPNVFFFFLSIFYTYGIL